MCGDLGISFRFGEPVSGNHSQPLSRHVTIRLCSGLSFGALLAVPTGVLAATRPGGWIDRMLTSVNVCWEFRFRISFPDRSPSSCSPSCWAGCQFRAVPAGHFILPAVTLGASLSAILTRMVRAGMIEELQEEYVKTARAKGLPEIRVLLEARLQEQPHPGSHCLGPAIRHTSWPVQSSLRPFSPGPALGVSRFKPSIHVTIPWCRAASW